MHQLTIELSDQERDRLETAARKLDLTPETYLRHLLEAELGPTTTVGSPLEAIRRLREIGRQMPPVDAVELMRQERDRLARGER